MVVMSVWYNIEWLQAGFIPGSDMLRVHSLQHIMVVIFSAIFNGDCSIPKMLGYFAFYPSVIFTYR